MSKKSTPQVKDQEEHSTSRIFGVTWNKAADILRVDFRSCLSANAPLTKRKMVAIFNGVYDIFGWVSLVMITAKILSSKLCLKGITGDEIVPQDLQKGWKLWIKGITSCQTVILPRSFISNVQGKFALHGLSGGS